MSPFFCAEIGFLRVSRIVRTSGAPISAYFLSVSSVCDRAMVCLDIRGTFRCRILEFGWQYLDVEVLRDDWLEGVWFIREICFWPWERPLLPRAVLQFSLPTVMIHALWNLMRLTGVQDGVAVVLGLFVMSPALLCTGACFFTRMWW